MKQMILLEPEDLAALRHGESRTLQVGTTEIVLGYAGPVLSRNGAKPVPGTAEFACETCGKAFDSSAKLGSHRFQVHQVRAVASPASTELSHRTCPTCGRVSQKRLNMLEHHRRVHGGPAPTSTRSGGGSSVGGKYARRRYKDVIVHAYGATRCSACHKAETTLQLFPATADGWQAHRKQRASSWTVYKRVADMLKRDGMTATKKLWHYGCRSCMHQGANAARKET